ncbi:MAG: ferritin family protein [Nitrospirae bacterium]|nr:ferritin family protein [Nitrospirota bacterium]
MITGKEDLLESLVEAFLMEKGTNIFYCDAALKASDPAAKKVFEDLSVWEEKHMDFIQFLYHSVQGDLDIEGFKAFEAKTEAPYTEAGIPVKDLEAKLERYSYIDDRAALKIALDIEAKAYNLYRGLSDTASDGNARVVFREMMDQEHKHISYLKALEKKLA